MKMHENFFSVVQIYIFKVKADLIETSTRIILAFVMCSLPSSSVCVIYTNYVAIILRVSY